MGTVEEIREAVQRLSETELTAFRSWFARFDADAWDSDLERDVNDGRLDSLAEEALEDLHRGRCSGL